MDDSNVSNGVSTLPPYLREIRPARHAGRLPRKSARVGKQKGVFMIISKLGAQTVMLVDIVLDVTRAGHLWRALSTPHCEGVGSGSDHDEYA